MYVECLAQSEHETDDWQSVLALPLLSAPWQVAEATFGRVLLHLLPDVVS